MATPHIVGSNLKLKIDSKSNKGIIEFDLLDPVPSKQYEATGGKKGMQMLLSTAGGFAPMGVNLDGKPLKGNIQIGF